MPNYLNPETLAILIRKGATCCHFQKNQIILYDSHVPIGIFIITSGEILVYSVSCRSRMEGKQHFICDKNYLILPSIENLNRKSSIQAKALRNCKALFVPKTIVLNDNLLTKLFEDLKAHQVGGKIR
jgi:CRP-like cAMP-binding protein